MIKIFKIFENINETPKENYYVIINYKNNIIYEIGKIISIMPKNEPFIYLVDFYDNFNCRQYGLTSHICAFRKDEIEYCSKNKKELEIIINTNKYKL